MANQIQIAKIYPRRIMCYEAYTKPRHFMHDKMLL